jgi:hypothetical protein
VPPNSVTLKEPKVTKAGDFLELACTANDANPKSNIVWYRGSNNNLMPISAEGRRKSRTLPRNPYLRGRLSTVDLLILAGIYLLLDIENIIYFFTQQATLMRRSTVLSLPLQLVFPV